MSTATLPKKAQADPDQWVTEVSPATVTRWINTLYLTASSTKGSEARKIAEAARTHVLAGQSGDALRSGPMGALKRAVDRALGELDSNFQPIEAHPERVAMQDLVDKLFSVLSADERATLRALLRDSPDEVYAALLGSRKPTSPRKTAPVESKAVPKVAHILSTEGPLKKKAAAPKKKEPAPQAPLTTLAGLTQFVVRQLEGAAEVSGPALVAAVQAAMGADFDMDRLAQVLENLDDQGRLLRHLNTGAYSLSAVPKKGKK